MKLKNTDDENGWPHRILRPGIVFILLLVPFHAFLTVWLASLIGHYDLIRLWKEIVLLGLAVTALLLLFKDKKLREWFLNDRLALLSVSFVALVGLNALVVFAFEKVSVRAVGFGLIVDTRMLIFMLVVWVALKNRALIRIPMLVMWPAIIIIGFGLMQRSLLPNDFLNHFGYGPDTILPVQAVDNNLNFPRTQSFMRGPNPLGAYLAPIIFLLFIGAVKFKSYKWYFIAAIVAALLVLFGTYSRSAWLGLIVGSVVFALLRVPSKFRKPLLAGMLALTVLFIGTVYILRDNDVVQNVVFHSSEDSPSVQSSNERRLSALNLGIKDAIKEPFGGGVGSAGPASVHNFERGGRQSENFFIQIGQELGIVGLGLFIAILAMIFWRLWEHKADLVVQATLAGLVSLIVINMLSHAWSDDSLVYVFGALLAYALSKEIMYKKRKL